MKKTLLFLLLIIITQAISVNSILNAQSHFSVRGRVVDQKTNEPNPVINFQIDMNNYEPGDYLIKLTITDLNNGETSEAQTQIILAEQ